MNSLNIILRLLKRSISKHFTKFALIEGNERNSNQPISVLFSGSNLNKSYLEKLIFGESRTTTENIKIWKNRSLRYMVDADRKHDIVITMSDTSFHDVGMFHVPCWIGGEWDLINQDKIRRYREKLNDDKRRVRKNNYSFRVTREPKEFDHFYNNMHKPYINRVFKNHAFLMTHEEMKAAISKCELFYVTQNGQEIAGGILVYDGNNRVRAWSLGVKDGDSKWVRDGAIVALLQLQRKYLLENGFRRLHLGAARPFLKDGALSFKKNRGLELVDHTAKGFSILPLHECAGVHGFLQNNPFIYMEEEVLKGAIFIPEEKTLLKKDTEQLYHDWYFPGLECLELFYLKTKHCDDHKFRNFGYIDKLGMLHTSS